MGVIRSHGEETASIGQKPCPVHKAIPLVDLHMAAMVVHLKGVEGIAKAVSNLVAGPMRMRPDKERPALLQELHRR